jgi:hypothetical protein
MNNKKICFITAVNDEVAYEECLFYIKNLNIPQGYDIEVVGIRNSYCMTHSYNKAMKDTDAKYKIYLHQDVLIINKNFIYDILNIFADDEVGMIGVCGAKHIPTNGIWWESKNKVGKIYDSNTGKMKLLDFKEMDLEYESVQVIDGLIMATQHDIEWREDLFDGWHFYDTSQSIEFYKSGYKVVVPSQIDPWCIHDCGIANISNGYEEYRQIFLKNYDLVDINVENLFDFDQERASIIMNNNMAIFNEYIDKINILLKNKNYEEVAMNTYKAAIFAYANHPGFFVCENIEKSLIECAKNIPISNLSYNIKKESEKRRVLHVISEGYDTGGHTRLVKNWIKRDSESVHSLVTTWQSTTIPKWLTEAIEESGGNVISLESISDKFMEKASELRKIAYEWADIVVLHVHMNDPIPTIAFGVDGGPPIIHMNHADHCFWIGASIIDVCVDISKYGQLLTLNRRGIYNSLMLPIPLSLVEYNRDEDKDAIREKYGIKKDTTVLLTIASEYKFKSFNEGIDYCSIMKTVVNKFEDVILIVIGPENIGKWKDLNELTDGKVKIMGLQANVENFYKISDIYIESFIMGSFTSRLDGIKYGLPAIKFKNDIYPNMSVLNDRLESFNCKNINEMISFIDEFKNEKNSFIKNKAKDMTLIVRKQHIEDTKKYIDEIYSRVKKHTVSHNNIDNNINEYDLFWTIYNKI